MTRTAPSVIVAPDFANPMAAPGWADRLDQRQRALEVGKAMFETAAHVLTSINAAPVGAGGVAT